MTIIAKILILILTLFYVTVTYSQNFINERLDNYDDVLVIINQNSTISDSIGRYFALMRNIPPVNILRINAPIIEEIDTVDFNSIRNQIENYIIQNNLLYKINYIVTTKGLPLKVNRGNTFSTTSPSSSVESELTLILSANANKIGANGYITSPYFLQKENFSRSKFDMFLVTRLDGYNFEDVKRMIDKSSAYLWIDSTMQFIFDQDPTWNSTIPYLNNSMTYASTLLQQKGLKTLLDNTTTFLTHKENVIGYTSFGSNDYNAHLYTTHAKPQNNWASGAIAETYVSTSGRTFTKPVTYGQSLIADLISEGITGVKGYVYEPYSNAMAIVWHLFDMYTDGYNLAESFYSASRALSWMDIIVGDPKMRIFTPRTTHVNFSANRVANSLNIKISWTTAVEYQNAYFIVERKLDATNTEQNIWKSIAKIPGKGTTIFQNTYNYVDKHVKNGNYIYRLTIVDSLGNKIISNPITLSMYRMPGMVFEPPSTDDNYPIRLEKKDFGQNGLINFPNPFNPTTEIFFKVEEDGNVKLTLYNTLGQKIQVLVDNYFTKGLHHITFTANNLSSGIYFCTLETNNKIQTIKMIYSK